MTAGTLCFILASVSLSALAQIAFKLGVGGARAASPGGLLGTLLSPGVLVGLVLYGIGTLLWLTALARVEVSRAYPFVGLGFVLTAVLGAVLLGEPVGPRRIAGIALVIAGIAVLARP